MKSSSTWIPSSMEQTCLKHLDRPGSWAALRSDQPEQTDLISWRHVRRVFRFNLGVFATAFTLLFGVVAVGSGYPLADFKEDLPAFVILTAAISGGMALYVTKLYQRSWNRRARYLNYQEGD